jgi:hypothetical protein
MRELVYCIVGAVAIVVWFFNLTVLVPLVFGN